MEASLLWDSPSAGAGNSEIDQMRGIQWRLVMAWSGFEPVLKAALGNANKGVSEAKVEKICDCCNLNDYVMLKKRPPTRDLQKWIDAEWKQGDSAVLDYFSLTHSDVRKSLDSFLVQSKPITTWVESLQLAKAMRHASAHGYLSANKIRRWGLKSTFIRLTRDVGEVTAAIFESLGNTA